MIICFIAYAVIFIAYTSILWSAFILKNSIVEKHEKKIFPFIVGMNIILAVIGIIDLFGFVRFRGYSGAEIVLFAYGILTMLLFRYRKKLHKKYELLVRNTVKILSICLFLEIFIFNFSSAHILSYKYKQKELDLNTTISENFDINSRQNIASGYTSFELKDIDLPVGTVMFNVESSQKPTVNISIDVSDDTYSEAYRNNIASAEIISGNKKSRTAVCNFSGNVKNLKFSFYTDNGEYITVNGITLNSPVPFCFSITRFLIFFLSGVAVYFLTVSPVFRKNFNECKRTVVNVSWGITAVLVVISLVILNGSRYQNPGHSIGADFKSKWGNQITQEIVDAFESGSTALNMDVDSGLLEIENPYDESQREAAINEGKIAGYMWDHLLFEGKYYSYYGIAPVLLIFLPYHLLTGYYFPSVWAVWLFSVGGILFLTAFYLSFAKRFFASIRSSLVLCGFVILQLVTGIYFCLSVTNFYEIAQSSGFFFVTGGAFFLICSNVIGEGKIKNPYICLSSVFLSLSVLCRPTLAVYCIAALFFIAAGYMKNKRNKKKNSAYLSCSILPFVIIGLVQMIYNFMRFGSPFDFGIQYSLTINDFTHAEYHTKFVFIGFMNYLFTLPDFSSNFPFIHMKTAETFYPQGYYFTATGAVLGILWKALPVLSYCYSAKAYRSCTNSNKKLYTLLVAIVCVICPFVIIFSIWESGYSTRYSADFAWQIVLGALIIAFTVYNKCSKATKSHLNKLMTASTALCVIFTFAQTYVYVSPMNNWSYEWIASLLSFQRLFEFWR